MYLKSTYFLFLLMKYLSFSIFSDSSIPFIEENYLSYFRYHTDFVVFVPISRLSTTTSSFVPGPCLGVFRTITLTYTAVPGQFVYYFFRLNLSFDYHIKFYEVSNLPVSHSKTTDNTDG